MIQNNYLHEDFEKVSNNLDVLHEATMNILKGSTAGDFDLIEKSQIEIEKSKKTLYALHMKKLKRDEFQQFNNGIYSRRGWLEKDKCNKDMEIHYFTFGLGHELAGHCQPIHATSTEEALNKMKKLYGLRWEFHYTKAEYESAKSEGIAHEIMLDPVYAGGD